MFLKLSILGCDEISNKYTRRPRKTPLRTAWREADVICSIIANEWRAASDRSFFFPNKLFFDVINVRRWLMNNWPVGALQHPEVRRHNAQ